MLLRDIVHQLCARDDQIGAQRSQAGVRLAGAKPRIDARGDRPDAGRTEVQSHVVDRRTRAPTPRWPDHPAPSPEARLPPRPRFGRALRS